MASLIDDPNQDTPTPRGWQGGRDFNVKSTQRGHTSHEHTVVQKQPTDPMYNDIYSGDPDESNDPTPEGY